MIPVDWAILIAVYFGLFYSMVLHEIAHAATALWFGDDTAQRLGRISLDPVRHVDPVMTLLIPGMLLWASGGRMAFGGALPVPVDPRRLRNPRHDLMWIAAAGPLTNVAIAVVLALSINLLPFLAAYHQVLAARLLTVIVSLIGINLMLVAFNLLPVPPLDGSKILAAFLPERLAESYLSLSNALGLMLVVVLVFSGATSQLVEPVQLATKFLLDSLSFFR